MKYKKLGETYIVRLEIGEELFECMLKFAETENIKIAQVSGIGASSCADAGIFNAETKTYLPVSTEKFMEIVSLMGSLTRKDGLAHLHLHCLLADPVSGQSLAGHLTKLVVGATAEIFVNVLPGEVNRTLCNKTGLYLMDV